MFEFEYLNQPLQRILENPGEHLAREVCEELPQFLEALRRDGQVSKAEFFTGGVLTKGIFKISAHTFDLHYSQGSTQNRIKLIYIKPKSLILLRERFNIEDSWDDKNILHCIPQYDVPEKIIRAIEFVNQKIDDSYELGRKLGHKGKCREYIVRHGNYAKVALSELGLITRVRQGRVLRSEVTTKGKLIAESSDDDTKKRLLIEAMLNYEPVWLIMGKVTEGGHNLNDELILQTIFSSEVRDANTSPRRSKTIKRWIKWIADYSGIPIHIEGVGLQLTIPMLYAK